MRGRYILKSLGTQAVSIITAICRNRSARQNIASQIGESECEVKFYNSAITKPVVCAHIVVERVLTLQKGFLFNHTTPFSTKGLEKSLCDFTGTIFVQCENPVIASLFVNNFQREEALRLQNSSVYHRAGRQRGRPPEGSFRWRSQRRCRGSHSG